MLAPGQGPSLLSALFWACFLVVKKKCAGFSLKKDEFYYFFSNFNLGLFRLPGCVELGVVEEVHPIDDVEDEEEDGKHDDSVAFDFEQDLFVVIFKFQIADLFFILDVLSGGGPSGLHIQLGRGVVY